MNKKVIIIAIFICSFAVSFAQPPLPDLAVKKGVQNHVIIAWHNIYGDMVTALTIQRSYDSIRGFRTVYSSENPSLQINAYTDNQPVPGMDYYRIYYTMKNGSYNFTKAKKPAMGFRSDNIPYALSKTNTIQMQGDKTGSISLAELSKLSDSVLYFTTDSLLFIDSTNVMYKKMSIQQYVKSIPTQTLAQFSSYISITTDGDPIITLPPDKVNNYSMTVFEPNGKTVLYKINKFTDSQTILSKSSFFQSGFYPYELYENGKLKERNSLQIK